MSQANRLFTETNLIKALKAPEDVLANNTLYPASAAFINVGDFDRFTFLILAGGITNQQTFQVQQATAIDGTPKDVTGAVQVIATNGDDKWYAIEVGVDQLDVNNGYCFVTLKNSGGASGDYADLIFLGHVPGMAPVTHGADKGAIVELVG